MEEPLTALGRDSAGTGQADDSSLDTVLLARISRERDPAAMTSFFERYKGPAYKLALHLTGSREEAEDVLQEALLVVWQRAGLYRRSGPACSWLLKIVAFKALQLRRGERRGARRIQNAAQIRSLEGQGCAGAELLGPVELAGTLQTALRALPDSDRFLLLLHYAADLRVTEIARQCRMSRQTVKYRLKRALGLLRTALGRSGRIASALPRAPLLLQDALAGPAQPPENLGRQLIERLLSHPGARAQASGWRGPAWAAATTAVLCAAVGFSVLPSPVAFQTRKDEPRPSAAKDSSGDAASRGAGPSQGVPFVHRFSFATPQHIRFPVTQGAWNWQPAVFGASGGLVVDPGRPLFCFLPVRIPRQPLLLELRLRLQEMRRPELSPTHFACGALRAERSSMPPYRQYKNRGKWGDPFKDEYRYQAYLLERFTVGLFETDWLHYVHEFEESYPGDRILIELENWVVAEIRVRALREEEIPAWAQDPLSLLRGLEVSRTQFPRTSCGLFLESTGEAVACTPSFP